MQIWKFSLIPSVQYFDILMPVGTELLQVHEQNGAPYIWGVCDPTQATEYRKFLVVGTGWEINFNLKHKYLGSAHCGEYVWHVFEFIGEGSEPI